MANNSDDSPWEYNPSLGAAIFFCILYFLQGAMLVFHMVRFKGYRFGITVMVGILFEIAGYALRADANKNQDQVGPYAAQQSLIVLAPLFVAAGNYLIISRLICSVYDDNTSRKSVLCIPARRLTPIFVTCDVVNLLVQVAGTTISAAVDWEGSQGMTGNYVLIGGLAVQTATISFFCIIALRFTIQSAHMTNTSGHEPWRKALRAVFGSSIMILLRCIYRLIEFATGINAYLFNHEWPFYVLEALPMVVALALLVTWYPPAYLPLPQRKQRDSEANLTTEK